MEKYIIALDQGTTSSRCILFNKSGEICSIAQKEFQQIYPQPGWVEHDPMDIWSTQVGVMMEAMSKINATPENIHGIGITNQRETTVVWNKITGKPVYNAIVWQCRRTSDRIDQLKKEGMETYISDKTGLIPDAYFSATKIEWILENVPGARTEADKGNLLFGTVDTWLVWNLTKGKVHVTDFTNASRTMIYDIHKLEWDKKLLEYFHIPEKMLPEVKSSSEVYGYIAPEIMGKSVPIAGIAGDQQAALFGQCCFLPGEIKNTYGTGCFLLMNTGHRAVKSNHGLLTTLIATSKDKPDYALEGSVFIAGAAIQWLRDELGLISSAAESEDCCKKVEDTAGVYVVPAFTGLGAPYWNQRARGIITGLTRGANKNHIVRATVESLAYEVYDLIEVMKRDAELDLVELKVDGGASSNDFLMQFQADILGATVVRPDCIETTALGAAYLAGLATNYWTSEDEIRENWKLSSTFTSEIGENDRLNLLKGWFDAVAKIK